MHLIDILKKFSENKPVLFTTPGHLQGYKILPEIEDLLGKKVFKADFSEIIGLDNLQNPAGVLLKSQIRASEIYGSKYSYYLVNGSSSGILALMLSTVKPGEKVLIARNIHKSVVNALILSGAEPVWINPEWHSEWNIPIQLDFIKIKKALENNPDIKSVWLTNPTYEGVITDIASIAELCRKKEILFIVDEAHGALWNFSKKLPTSAIQQGADASVQSLHKTASSLTQGAILHLGKFSRINPETLQQCLNIVNTTSPSYVILASIEGAIEYLYSKQGGKTLDNLLENIDIFKQNLSKYKDILFLKKSSEYSIDKTKLFLGIKGVSGQDLADILFEKYNIEVELNNDRGILALTGIGTSRKNLDKLTVSIVKSKKLLKNFDKQAENIASLVNPKVIFTPSQAFYKKSKKINLQSSLGLISKETIVAYPPGIPILIAGEMIQQEHINLLKNYKQIDIILD
ncbi:MAG: aminotransferase class I/II-fold pyridoxal phosphate-dependent enzyme [bacterium]